MGKRMYSRSGGGLDRKCTLAYHGGGGQIFLIMVRMLVE